MRSMRTGLWIMAAIGVGLAMLAAPAFVHGQDDGKGDTAEKRRIDDGRGNDGPETRVRPPGDRDTWRLGVTIEEREIGLRITDVEARSAAERAGLERGDLIITVDGEQVGRVAGRRVDFGDALRRHVDQDGRVRLLVQNRRDDSLVNVDVKFDRRDDNGGPTADQVSGTITIYEKIGIPASATMNVKLVEFPRRGRPRTVVEKNFARANRLPLSFDLRFNTNDIDSRLRYEIQAELRVDGRVWFAQDQPAAVLTGGSPNRVDIVLRRPGR